MVSQARCVSWNGWSSGPAATPIVIAQHLAVVCDFVMNKIVAVLVVLAS